MHPLLRNNTVWLLRCYSESPTPMRCVVPQMSRALLQLRRRLMEKTTHADSVSATGITAANDAIPCSHNNNFTLLEAPVSPVKTTMRWSIDEKFKSCWLFACLILLRSCRDWSAIGHSIANCSLIEYRSVLLLNRWMFLSGLFLSLQFPHGWWSGWPTFDGLQTETEYWTKVPKSVIEPDR